MKNKNRNAHNMIFQACTLGENETSETYGVDGIGTFLIFSGTGGTEKLFVIDAVIKKTTKTKLTN